jgi:DNA mismatch endonuclease, patch repair protein
MTHSKIRPSSEAVSRRMSRQASRDTGMELVLRSVLHARGLRFRVHRRPLRGLKREADLVFPGPRVAVFVDGCFWHGCEQHGTWPKANAEFWRTKIEGNRARDLATDAALADAGWLSIRVWEHEPVTAAAIRVERDVRARTASLPDSVSRRA